MQLSFCLNTSDLNVVCVADLPLMFGCLTANRAFNHITSDLPKDTNNDKYRANKTSLKLVECAMSVYSR